LKNVFKRAQQGFTLLELMIVISIFTVMVTPFIYFEIYSAEGVYKNIHRMELTEEGNRILDWIAKDFRVSKSMLEEYNGRKLAPDTLILSLAGHEVIVYRLDTKKRLLSRTLYKHPQNFAFREVMELAVNVDTFTFSPVDSNISLIEVTINLSKQLLHFPENLTLHGVAGRRIR